MNNKKDSIKIILVILTCFFIISNKNVVFAKENFFESIQDIDIDKEGHSITENEKEIALDICNELLTR